MLVSIFIDSCSVKTHSIPCAAPAETSLSDMIRKKEEFLMKKA